MEITYESAKDYQNKLFSLLILLLLICFVAIGNLFWLAHDTRPSSWDQSTHLVLSIKYMNILTNPSMGMFRQLLDVSSYYPPFYHLSLIPSLLFFGVSPHSAAMVNILYLGLLIIFTYKIGARLFDRQTGLLAAFVVSMYQFLIYLSRSPLIEVALTALVVMAIYFLLCTQDFSRRQPAIMFGIIFGLGMLTKWTFFFFLMVPLLVAIINVGRRLDRPFRAFLYLLAMIILAAAGLFLAWVYQIIILVLIILVARNFWTICRSSESASLSVKNILLAFLIACVICIPWYSYNLVKLAMHITSNLGQIAVAEGDPVILTLGSFLYYAGALVDQTQLVFLVLFLVGLVIFLIKWDKKNLILLEWLVIPYLVFVLLRNKDMRFTVPYLPAVSIISVAWLSRLKKVSLKKIIIAVIFIIGIGQFFLFSYTMKYFPPKVALNTPVYKLGLYASYPPKQENWQHKEIFEAIEKDFQHWDKPFALVRVISNYNYFHGESFEVYTMGNKLPIYPMGYQGKLGEFTDYLIYKTGDQGPPFTIQHYDQANKEINSSDPAFTSLFKVMDEVFLPDGSKAIIYKREAKPEEDVKINEVQEKLKEWLTFNLGVNGSINLQVIPFSFQDTARGHFRRIIIRIDEAKIKELKIKKAEFELEDVWLSLYHLRYRNECLLLSVKSIKPAMVITENDIEDFLSSKIAIQNIQSLKVSLKDGLLIITGMMKWHGLSLPLTIRGDIALKHNKEVIITRIQEIAWGPFRIPGFMYWALMNRTFSLRPTPDWSMETEIKEISINNRMITVR
jgi:4-amino-4-deoxy-L-arabinose transferase-like glycosyltransferase